MWQMAPGAPNGGIFKSMWSITVEATASGPPNGVAFERHELPLHNGAGAHLAFLMRKLFLLFALIFVAACGKDVTISTTTIPVTPTQSCTSGAAGGTWQQLTLPSAMTAGAVSINSLYAAHDCYLYVSMIANGTWRAKVSDLKTNPTTASSWTRIDAGFPAATLNPGTAPVNSWLEDGLGNLYAGIGSVTVGAACPTCTVGKWNGSAWTFSASPPGARTQLRNLQMDAGGNILLSDLQSTFWESTDGGSVFNLLVSDPYRAFGQPSGMVYAMTLYNGQIYWGGEGPYMQSPQSMASGAVIYGASYTGNAQWIIGDGSASTSPTFLLACSRQNSQGYGLSRYVVATNTWTDEGAANGIPRFDRISNKALVKGVAHEFLAGFGHALLLSTDDGITWTSFTAGLPSAEANSDKSVAISPLDDSKYLVTDTAIFGSHELWYHP